MEKVVCPNCGAAIYDNEPKCPFCGYINIKGAEEKFMRDVQKTEADLSQIPEMQKKDLKKKISGNSRIIIITLVVVGIIVGIIVGASLLWEYILYNYEPQDPKAQLQWEYENFPVIDEMYENGDYDGMLEYMFQLYRDNDENKTNYTLSNWEHYPFLLAYMYYDEFTYVMEDLDKNGELSDYDAESVVYTGLWYYYRVYDDTYSAISEEEVAKLDEYRELILVDFYGRLGFSEEEIKSIEDEIYPEGYLEIKKCWKYAKKVKDRFK